VKHFNSLGLELVLPMNWLIMVP